MISLGVRAPVSSPRISRLMTLGATKRKSKILAKYVEMKGHVYKKTLAIKTNREINVIKVIKFKKKGCILR